MSPAARLSAPTYRAAYATLSRIAAELESGDADLDRVLPLLEKAQAAYAVCQERIEAVRTVLAGESGLAEGSLEHLPEEAVDLDAE